MLQGFCRGEQDLFRASKRTYLWIHFPDMRFVQKVKDSGKKKVNQ